MYTSRFFSFFLPLVLGANLVLPGAGAASAEQVVDPLAIAFGKVPQAWALRLSPDGSRIAYLRMVDGHTPFLYVLDADGKSNPVLSSVHGKYQLRWCRWANNKRLLCGLHGNVGQGSEVYPVSRLVAVNADGTDVKVLLQHELRNRRVQFMDEIIDLLPDDPSHVLIEMPDNRGSGISKLDIYSGKTTIATRSSIGTRRWISDGHGIIRLKLYMSREKLIWSYRLADEKKWRQLYKARMTDESRSYVPVGFGSDRNKLLVLKSNGDRQALWEEDLENNLESRLIFSHPNVDVTGYRTIGKYGRLVAATYATDTSHSEFFDQKVERVFNAVGRAFPDGKVSVLDESWDQRFYLVTISNNHTPGQYYQLDTRTNNLEPLWHRQPELKNFTLATMTTFRYSARDGEEIPGYLTLPPDADGKNLPTVVMPHGGPESRDILGYYWLAQFMAAKGYAVLQSNFRGSGGYGDAWSGEGGFRAWRRTIDDLTDGAESLIDQGITDPDRICIVGWSYGGYAALLSAIEEPRIYKCTVSVAGVTDPLSLIREKTRFLAAKSVEQFVGTDDEVIKRGSPLKRASEIKSPVLIFHGDRDINVAVNHSKKMHAALENNNTPSELVIYEDTAHSIWRDDYRIDLLDKLGKFLDRYIGNTNPGTDEAIAAR